MLTDSRLTRRGFLVGSGLLLSACTPVARNAAMDVSLPPPIPADIVEMYASVPGERFPVPAIDPREIDPAFWRRIVDDRTGEQPGTITVDTASRYLYLSMGDGKAMRYGIGVGKEGLAFTGRATIARKAEWPRWTPTQDMIRREPERYGPVADGLPGGVENPLGARALYLYRGGRDTLYRLHGTIEPWSIGQAVSSGCVRLLNQDVIDLYRRTPTGSLVVVRDHEGAVV